MVVCKYFLQGTCKFGTYCNYEHQAPSNYTSFSENNQHHQSTSILRQPNFSSAQATSTKPSGSTANVDINTLVKSVVNDMTGAEKGGQWLLSCYAPFKEKPALPGFEDQSPEEIRLGFYEAQKNGTIEQYKAQLQALLQSTMMKIKALQNPAQDAVTVLQNIYTTPPSSCSGTYGQNVITASTSILNQQNTFTLQTQNKPGFGQTNENIFQSNNQPNTLNTTNIFAGGTPQSNFSGWQENQGQTNLFGSPPNQNIFGSNTYSKNQSSIFGGQQGSNIFANSGQSPNNSSNIFASPPLPVPQQPSIFGGAQTAQQSTNIFASTVVPTHQNQNVFSPQNTNQQSIFSQQPSQQGLHNVFATQNQPQNIQTQTVFSSENQKQQLQNIFSANPNATQFSNSQLTANQAAPPNYSASIFGYSANTNPSVGFGPTGQQHVDESLYSKLEELTDEDKKWFESNTLDIMNIPDKPPTYDMCFQV